MSSTTLRFARLTCGIAAGPLLLGTVVLDGTTRPGYDPYRHGVSQLGLGERGWLTSTAFLVCGLLVAVFAYETMRTVDSGPGSTWGPRLLGATAMGLVLAGAFPTDPALGYPPGEAERMSVSGGIHQLGGFLLFGGLVGAALVWGRRFTRESRHGWATCSIATAVLLIASSLSAGVVYRLVQRQVLATGPAGLLELVAIALGFTWVLLIALDLLRRA